MISYPHVYGPDPARDPNLAALLEQLDKRFNHAICGTLVYGSCLRSGDIYDGLLDLYLLVDSYSDAYSQRRLAAANWLLPPNVFYAQQEKPADGVTLRSKVTVISLRDFERGCSPAWFESYLWGRFAQPTLVLGARDQQVHSRVRAALGSAAYTLLRRTIPQLPPSGDVIALWEAALSLSYGTELRTERTGRARELVEASRSFYHELAAEHAEALGLVLEGDASGPILAYHHNAGAWQKRVNRIAWATRRIQGKFLSIARLVKALFTFEGGLDYIAWKLERHSGEKIEIPERVRRRPLIHLWAFFWGLYRRGIFK